MLLADSRPRTGRGGAARAGRAGASRRAIDGSSRPNWAGGRRATGTHGFLAGALPGNQLSAVDFTTLTLRLRGLPAAWDGLTILHLSDLHFYGTPDRDYFRHPRCIRRVAPDLVAITGDIVDGRDDAHTGLDRAGPGPAALERGRPSPSWATTTTGTTSTGCRSGCAALGMHVVSNRWEAIDVRGEPLVAIGHEGPWLPPAARPDRLPERLPAVPQPHAGQHRAGPGGTACDLMLSGHDHGGQIRLPLVGSMFVPSRYGRRSTTGDVQRAADAAARQPRADRRASGALQLSCRR